MTRNRKGMLDLKKIQKQRCDKRTEKIVSEKQKEESLRNWKRKTKWTEVRKAKKTGKIKERELERKKQGITRTLARKRERR